MVFSVSFSSFEHTLRFIHIMVDNDYSFFSHQFICVLILDISHHVVIISLPALRLIPVEAGNKSLTSV